MKLTWLLAIVLRAIAASKTFEETKEEFSNLMQDIDFKEMMKELVDSYDFTEDSIISSYDYCKDIRGPKALSCFIDTTFKKRILEKHHLLLCFGEYFGNTAIECALACFHSYNPECLRCLGNFLERFFECLQEAPYDHML